MNAKVGEHAPAASRAPAQRRCVLLHAPGSEVPAPLVAGLGRQMGRLTVFTDAYAAAAEILAHEQERRRGTDGQPRAAAPAEERVCLVLVDPVNELESRELVETLHRHTPGVPCWWYGRAPGMSDGAHADLHPVGRDVLEAWAASKAQSSSGSIVSANEPAPAPSPTAIADPAHRETRTSRQAQPDGGPITLARIGPPADRWPVFGYDADTGTMEGVPRTPQLRLIGDPAMDADGAESAAARRAAGGPVSGGDPTAMGLAAMALTEEELAVLLGDEPPPPGPVFGSPPPPRGGV